MNWTGLANSGIDIRPFNGALGGVVDVVEVGDARAGDVQNLLDVLALVTQHLGQVVELVDRADQCRVVLLQKAFDVDECLVERSQGVVQMGRAVGEHLRDRCHVSGERDDLFVARRQRVDQHLQVLYRAEDVGARIPQPASGLRELAQRVVERVAVAVERVGRLVDHACPAVPAAVRPRDSAAWPDRVSACLTSSHSTGTAVRTTRCWPRRAWPVRRCRRGRAE